MASSLTFPDEYRIDDEDLKVSVPRLFYDADSSRHSALIDAFNGKNLVIEGPPGTGKSQSITNLIASALAGLTRPKYRCCVSHNAQVCFGLPYGFAPIGHFASGRYCAASLRSNMPNRSS